MKKLGIPVLLFGLMLSAQGFAATAQQNKMTTCNADASAKSLKGDERKTFGEHLPESGTAAGGHPAGEDENLQRYRQHSGAQRGRAQEFHE